MWVIKEDTINAAEEVVQRGDGNYGEAITIGI
jgi:hypothetical protein